MIIIALREVSMQGHARYSRNDRSAVAKLWEAVISTAAKTASSGGRSQGGFAHASHIVLPARSTWTDYMQYA